MEETLLTPEDQMILLDFPWLKRYLTNERERERTARERQAKQRARAPKPSRDTQQANPCPACGSTNPAWYPSFQKKKNTLWCQNCYLVYGVKT